MNKKVFAKLEFDKILNMLADKALSDSAKQAAISLKPSKSVSAVLRLQSETLEAESILMRLAKSPMIGFSDIGSETSRLKAGADLSCRELLRILGVLKSARRARKGLTKTEGSANLLPEMAEQLFYDEALIAELDDAIISDTELSDTASHELFSIRKRIMRENEGIREKLNAVIRSSHHKEHLQDAIITMRNGRFVVPVKQEFKRSLKGLVHDQSASGQTVFIEPMEVVEANNKLRELELAERSEIEHILHVFSERLREHWSALAQNRDILTRLDLIFAKAALASTMKASPPTITDEKKIIIKNGRHPLIDAKEVVPVSLHIDDGYSGLIITGPNTGGKTVTLKLTGLLALMAQSGMFVPADSGTTMPVFGAIFADIGDEQSIEQSLSTFSSHMINITRITNMADENSLVLLDELGAGTDPAEGAALAMAILEELSYAKSFVMATTHYSEIKAFAMASDIYQNACMEFSVRTLSPTYRLIMGVPGVSNAFEISKKLGLNEQIIERAREHMSEETVKFEQLIGEAERQREMAELKEQQAEGFRRTAQSTKDKSDIELLKAKEKRKIIIAKANEKALDILKDARDEAERIITELKLSKSVKQEEINAARKVLNDKIDKTASLLHQKQKKTSNVTPDQISVGDTVTLINHGVVATVLKAPKAGKVFVQAGVIKMSVELSEVEPTAKEKQIGRLGGYKRDMSRPVSMEVDLRGMSLDEAVMETDKFLDEAFIAERIEIAIIHGKGTGVLRAGIRDFLRTHPHVDKYREGKYGEGEAGVTIVAIK